MIKSYEQGTNTQYAPYPEALRLLVANCKLDPDWQIHLDHIDRGQGSEGLTLIITTLAYDTYHPERGRTYRVNHYFPVPPAAYDVRSWRRWLFEQYQLVLRHEGAEMFQIDGERPYAPSHGPGNDPYMVREVGTELDTKTQYTGAVHE